MSRGRWVLDRESKKLVPADEFYAREERGTGPIVIRDIEPYRSVVTGEVIQGRRQHRDHLRAHDLVEIGNEKLPPRGRQYPGDPRQDIAQVMKERGVIG